MAPSRKIDTGVLSNINGLGMIIGACAIECPYERSYHCAMR